MATYPQPYPSVTNRSFTVDIQKSDRYIWLPKRDCPSSESNLKHNGEEVDLPPQDRGDRKGKQQHRSLGR